MVHLIDKDALVSEIERLKEEIESQDYAAYTEAYIIGVKHTLETISDILNTLEVKDVDLEKEMNEALTHLTDKDMRGGVRYFFELGLKAQKGEEV